MRLLGLMSGRLTQRTRFTSAGVILASGLCLLITVVSLADTPKPTATRETGPTSWPSFRNGNELQGIAYSRLPGKLELLWKLPVQDGVTATAAIVGDHVFAATFGGELICINRKTGKRIWTYFSAEKKKKNDFIPGFQASPTVTGELVVIGDEDGVFHAVDRATGKQRWTFQTQAEIIASAAVVGERLIFGSYDARLYCLDAATGKLIWDFETQDRINGSPAIAGKITFVTGCDQHLRAINIETGKEEFAMNLERFLIASPSVLGSMLYVGTHESDFLAIDLNKQEVAWSYKDGKRELPYHSSAAVTNDVVLVGSQDKQLHCIDRRTGQRKWAFSARAAINSSPVLVGDRIFVGSNDGNLYEVGLSDGKQRSKFKIGRSVSASPAIGEGVLVIGAEGTEGEIHCYGRRP